VCLKPKKLGALGGLAVSLFSSVDRALPVPNFWDAAPALQIPGLRRKTLLHLKGEINMADSVYKVIELVGTSTESWEKAASNAVNRAAKSLRDLRVAEVSQLDMQMEGGKVKAYRAKVKVSFKFEGS
jgi:flavin-binding protein dodecin